MVRWIPPVIEWDELEELEQLIEDDKMMRAQMAAVAPTSQLQPVALAHQAHPIWIPPVLEWDEADELEELIEDDKVMRAQNAAATPSSEDTTLASTSCIVPDADSHDVPNDLDAIENQGTHAQATSQSWSLAPVHVPEPVCTPNLQKWPFPVHDSANLDCLGPNGKICWQAMIECSTKEIECTSTTWKEVV
jgi:hypothetical protein